jgi:hypothetical protein
MKPTALVLNMLVATLSTLKFSHAGYFSWGHFLAICHHVRACRVGQWHRVPLALGIHYDRGTLQRLLAVVLTIAALKLILA